MPRMAFFEGFRLEQVDTGEATLRVRWGGSGFPVVLLHGHPRTHVTWHAVAAELAKRYTVVCPDLRGYGESSHPPELPDHATYSKRAMAGDVVRLMALLGHERFCVVGHDRGAYVAYRLALDHPEAVARAVRPGRNAGAGAAGACRLAVRAELVALVFLRPDGQARRTDDQRGS